jgi:hypothetical protein
LFFSNCGQGQPLSQNNHLGICKASQTTLDTSNCTTPVITGGVPNLGFQDFLPDYTPATGSICKTGGFTCVLDSDCNNLNATATETATSLTALPSDKLHPAQLAATIIQSLGSGQNMLTEVEDGKHFDRALDLINQGHAAFIGGAEMQNLKTALGAISYVDFKQKLSVESKRPAGTSLPSTKAFKKALAAGALDVVGMAGPFGGAFSLFASVFGWWESNNLPSSLKVLGDKLVQGYQLIALPVYHEKMKELNGYIASFASEGRFVMDSVKAIAENPVEHGGTLQFTMLHTLEAALGSTRYRWMHFFGEPVCAGIDCTSKCASLRAFIPLTVPILASSHLALILQMVRSIATNLPLVKVLTAKFWRHVLEYQQYAKRWVTTNEHGQKSDPAAPPVTDPIYMCTKGSSAQHIKEFESALSSLLNTRKAPAMLEMLPEEPQYQEVRLPQLVGDVHVHFHRICGESLECLGHMHDPSMQEAAAFSKLARETMKFVKKAWGASPPTSF